MATLHASPQTLSRFAAAAVYQVDAVAVGHVAHAALLASNGIATALTAFAHAPYYRANNEILWLGTRLIAMHPRAVVIATPVPSGASVRLGALPKPCEAPQPPQCHRSVPGRVAASVPRRVAASAHSLRHSLDGVCPRGFGALWAGRAAEFPLDHAEPRVRALARAYASDDADAVCHASASLLGVGHGLTPSGDDLVGAALFARRFLAPDDRRWLGVAQRLATSAQCVTHAISAALLRDLLQCQSYAPLHALVEALLIGDDARALNAARVLVQIGHCSGWDMLSGLAIGLTGEQVLFAERLASA